MCEPVTLSAIGAAAGAGGTTAGVTAGVAAGAAAGGTAAGVSAGLAATLATGSITAGLTTGLTVGTAAGITTGVAAGAGAGAAAGGISLGTALTAAAIAGGVGLGIYGQVQQGRSARASSRFNEQVARNNALSAQYAARSRAAAGERQTDIAFRQRALLLGRGRTAFAAGNVLLGVGSPVDFEGDLAVQTGRDVAEIQRGTSFDVFGLAGRRTNLLAEASFDRQRRRGLQTARNIGLGRSLLSGGRQLANTFA